MSAEAALKVHRRSQRFANASGIDPRKFTLNRKMAQEIRDAQTALGLAEWLSAETGISVRGDEPAQFCEDLENGVVLCKLAAKFGQITRFRDPPANEFQRLENIELFNQAIRSLGVTSNPPPSRRDAPLNAYVPCLLELALLAKSHARNMEMDSSVPEEVLHHASSAKQEQAQEQAQEQVESKQSPSKDVVVIKSLSDEEDDEDGSTSINMGCHLHLDRMNRQRAGPPKLRLMDVGGRQLVAIERPGESTGSIVWQGAIELVNFLHTELGKQVFSAENKGSVLELGSGCGICGVWAACEGSDVVVSDVAEGIDLLWANVAANAQQVVKSGGSCSARPLDFADGPSVEKLVKSLSNDAPLTVVAADVVYGDTIQPFISALTRIFNIRPDTKLYLAYKERNGLQEQAFFEAFQFQHVGDGSPSDSGEASCRFYLVTGIKAVV